LALGKSVREIETLPARELDEWTAFYAMEPFGAIRDNWHAAVIACITANAYRAKGKAFSIQDFMYEDGIDRDARIDREQTQMVTAMFDHFDALFASKQ
jgi:hypothetical protein